MPSLTRLSRFLQNPKSILHSTIAWNSACYVAPTPEKEACALFPYSNCIRNGMFLRKSAEEAEEDERDETWTILYIFRRVRPCEIQHFVNLLSTFDIGRAQ